MCVRIYYYYRAATCTQPPPMTKMSLIPCNNQPQYNGEFILEMKILFTNEIQMGKTQSGFEFDRTHVIITITFN